MLTQKDQSSSKMDRLKLQESMNANGLESNYKLANNVLGTTMLSLAETGRQPTKPSISYASALAMAQINTDKTKQVGAAPNPHVEIKPPLPPQKRFPN